MNLHQDDTAHSSWITDHVFEPRIEQSYTTCVLPPNIYLCMHCRMAEAAHEKTTVKR